MGNITMPNIAVEKPQIDYFIPFAPLIGEEEKREVIDTLAVRLDNDRA